MNFTEAQLLNYTSQNNFLSDGEFRYGSTKVLSIESFIDARHSNADTSGVKESQEKIMSLVSGAHDFEEVIVNGHNFGLGRITSIDSESSPSWDLNQVRLGKHVFEIEISDSGVDNLYNMEGDHFEGLKDKFSKHHLLEDFSESFDFDNADDGSYSYAHSVSAKYFSGAEVTDPIGEAKSLAEGIFEQDPSFGFLNAQRSGFYNVEGKKYYKESYNLQTNACSFTKSLACLSNLKPKDSFCSEINHSLSSDENGIISVTESAQVMGLDDGGDDKLYESALNGLNNLVDTSRDRCTGVFSGYADFYGGDVDDLNVGYSSLQKHLNKISSNLTYEIIYNNNPNISGDGQQHNFTLSLDSNIDGTRSITENGVIVSPLNRGKVNPATLYNSLDIDNNSLSRCSNFYSGVIANGRGGETFFQQDKFNLIDSNIEYSSNGNKVSYTKSFSDMPSIINTDNISVMEINTSDVFKVNINNIFFIPNQGKEILHRRGLTTLSSREISSNCIYKKPPVNFWEDPSYAPIGPESDPSFFAGLQLVKRKMLEKAFNESWISNNEINSMFVSDFSYTVTSEQTLSATMSIVYEEQ